MKQQTGIFVTGTDTGVGKTVITAALASWFRNQGIDIGVMKPVETGCHIRSGRRIGSDSQLLIASAQCKDDPDLVGPYRLMASLAPALAAKQEGISIDLGLIVKSYKKLCAQHAFMLVEGIGGLMVPLSHDKTVLDMVIALKLPLLVIASNRLGAINHTLLTLRHAHQSGIPVEGVILNRTQRRSDHAIRTNADFLTSLIEIPLLAEIPYFMKLDPEKLDSGGMGRLLDHLDKGIHDLWIKLNA